MADPDPTLRDVIDRLDVIDARIDGISLDMGGLLTTQNDFERAATDTLRVGLAEVRAAVENFASTKADRSEVEKLSDEVEELRMENPPL